MGKYGNFEIRNTNSLTVKILIGTYYVKIDGNGRIMLPKGLRSQLKEFEDEGFVIRRATFFDNLELYPKQEWERWMQQILKIKKTSREKVKLISLMNAGARLITLDGQGRLQIPKDLVQLMQFKKELVIASEGNILQIWDKDAYERFWEENKDDFAELMEKLLDEETNNDNE